MKAFLLLVFAIMSQLQHPDRLCTPRYQSLKENIRTESYYENRSNDEDTESLFPCTDAITPSMWNYTDRLQTFRNWPYNIKPIAAHLAEAGFIYLNEFDRVKCFYCNGGLQNWRDQEIPWEEHAKWYPNCEYLLRSKGIKYVEDIGNTFPGLHRPKTQNIPSISPLPSSSFSCSPPSSSLNSPVRSFPKQVVMSDQNEPSSSYVYNPKKKTLEDAMSSEIVQQASFFGFEEALIKKVVKRKLKENNSEYDAVMSLINDLQQEEKNYAPIEEVFSMKETLDQSSSTVNKIDNLDLPFLNENVTVQNSSEHELHRENISNFGQNEVTPPECNRSSPSNNSSSDINLDEGESKDQDILAERTCKVCLDREINCVFMPCSHMCCCVECASALTKCPICRSRLRKIIKIYRK